MTLEECFVKEAEDIYQKQNKMGNYFYSTIATFVPCQKPSDPPTYVSESGSTYWQSDEGLTRYSDHWGSGVSTCDWFMGGDERTDCVTGEWRTGFVAWKDMYRKIVTIFGQQGYWGKENGCHVFISVA
ncbi:MAG: hypothetical protein ACXQTR_01805 [Candidatus Methanospirareceae archaeon]